MSVTYMRKGKTLLRMPRKPKRIDLLYNWNKSTFFETQIVPVQDNTYEVFKREGEIGLSVPLELVGEFETLEEAMAAAERYKNKKIAQGYELADWVSTLDDGNGRNGEETESTRKRTRKTSRDQTATSPSTRSQTSRSDEPESITQPMLPSFPLGPIILMSYFVILAIHWTKVLFVLTVIFTFSAIVLGNTRPDAQAQQLLLFAVYVMILTAGIYGFLPL